MGCTVSKGAAVPSPAYEVTTTTSLSSVLAASAYSVLRSASMGAAVVRLDAYEDDGGDDVCTPEKIPEKSSPEV
uniref:Uncharacterized protein n=1 Tax=Oryza glumipatula TaxID=40148 RepID=A0A0E0AWG5_9ORYZ